MTGIGIGYNNETLTLDCFEDGDLVGQGFILDKHLLLNLHVLDLGLPPNLTCITRTRSKWKKVVATMSLSESVGKP
jgi:hypothetical protein